MGSDRRPATPIHIVLAAVVLAMIIAVALVSADSVSDRSKAKADDWSCEQLQERGLDC